MHEIYWTARKGLGTAHLNREGKEVDFRPARMTHVQFGDIFAEPPKGQEFAIEPLRLEPSKTTVRVIRKDANTVGTQDVVDVLQTSFAGEEIIVESEVRWEWYNPVAKAACQADNKVWQENRQKRTKKQEDFINSFPAEEVARRATRSAVDRVRFGAISAEAVFDDVVTAAGKMAFGNDFRRDFWREVEYSAGKRCAEVKTAIIAADDKRRAAKKAAWMSKPKPEV